MIKKATSKKKFIRRYAVFVAACFMVATQFWAGSAQAQLLTGYEDAPLQPPPPQLQPQAPQPKFQPAPFRQQQQSSPMLTGYSDDVLRPAKVAETKVPSSESLKSGPVDLQADNLTHDDQNQIITASGNVMLVQAGRILRADEISYDLKADIVTASGDVVLNEENGDIHYAKKVQLNDRLKNGFVEGLQTYLADGSRFTAKNGERKDGIKTVMKGATYTPCEPCKEHPDRAPVWQIRASKVTHDSEEHKVSYRNARFEAFGVPIAYTPYFSHPDGTIKRKSGFLSPSAGYKSELGAFVSNSYYWAIAPDKDATIGLMAMTEEVPLAFGEYRQRWANAQIKLEGSGTDSARTENKAGLDVKQKEEARGHLFGEAVWDINDKWRAGADIKVSSDDQYLRQYDFSSEDVLENEIYVERFSGRNYSVARILAFQDLRIRSQQEDQPDVLPEIVTSFVSEPGSVPVIGGRWSADASVLGLRRGGDDQDLNRLALEAGWERRFVSDTGLLTSFDASIRGDAYSARDRDVATAGSGRSRDSSELRAFPQMHIQSSYPVARNFERFQATVEPVIALTIAPNVDVNNDIPNEDSQDVQIDASNLFEPNRFPGLDRIEDKSRMTYGIRTGLYGYGGSHADIFLGQSHRFDEDNNPFPEGSGLNGQESDFVGQVSALYKDDYSFNYRFQLNGRDLSSQRHEVDAYASFGRYSLNTRYLFAKELAGTDISSSREQIQETASYYIAEDWRLRGGAVHDLGDDSGLRKAHLGLDYFGQCISLSVIGSKSLTDDASGDSNTEVLFRIGLKNLGEFETSGIRVDGPDE